MTTSLRYFVLLLLLPFTTNATVDPTDGTFRTEVVDLSVKVPGGNVSWSRNYERNAWQFTPAWARLQFTLDDLDGSVLRIDRAGDEYEKIASDGSLFRFDARMTISRTESGWRWADRDGNWVDYAVDGRALQFGNRRGDTVSLHYSGEQLTSVSDRNGRTVLTLTWTGAQLTEVRDFSNRTVRYRYSNGLLSEVDDVRGKTWRYAYTHGKLSQLIDPLDRRTTLTLSDTGRTRTLTGPDGAIARYAFEYLNGQRQYYLKTTRENGELQEVIETWTDRDRELVRRDVNGITVLRVYRDGNKRIHEDYRGRRTVYDFDEFDNPTGVLYPDGSQTRTTYHVATSNVLTETDERGTLTEHQYNGLGLRTRSTEAKGSPAERVTTYAYDAQGRLVSMTTEADANTAAATTTYAYDDAGNLIRITDAENGVARFEDFDAMGNARTRIDARNQRWTSTYDEAGNLLSQTDPLSHTTSHQYDDVGNRIKTIFPPAEDGQPATETVFHYDAANRLIRTVDALGGERSTAYDRAGNRIEEVDESDKTTTYGYDRFNRLATITDGNANLTRYVYPDPNGAPTHAGDLYQPIRIEYPTFAREMKYDLRDRVHEQTEVFANAQGTQRTTTRTRFDTVGNAIEVIDAASRSTTHTYDARNRLTSTTDALEGVTRYAYDDRDNLLSLTDANENTHRFTYDRLNRTKTEARPMGQTHRYDYDAAGNLTRKADARNQVADYHYDEAGRRARIEYTRAGEASPHKTVTFTYNARNVLTGYADGTTSANYVYDTLQRKTEESVDYGDFVWTYSYGYAANGQKTSYTAIDGTTFSYGYDAAKNLSSIVIPNEGTIEYGDYRWTRPGRVTYPGGTVRTLTYDGLLRSERILVQNAASEVLMDYRYQYDAVGNITEKNTEHGPYRYEYDRVDRLTVADYPNGPQNDQINESMAPNTFPFADDRYTYDLLGNRLTDERQTQAFQWQYNRNNELLHSGFATYEYNESGSTTAKKDPGTGQPIQSYRYNSEERMDEVRDSEGNLAAEYYYDPFGRRLWKTLYPGAEGHPGGTEPVREYLAYSEEGYAATSYNPQQAVVLLFEPDTKWSSEILGEIDRLSVNYYFASLVGVALMSRNGGESSPRAFRYDASGAAYGFTGGLGQAEPRFPGQLADRETSLYYNFHRTLVPNVGRYAEIDPIGHDGGINLYLYALANPVMFIDPDGRRPARNGAERCDCSDPTSEHGCCSKAKSFFSRAATGGKPLVGIVICCGGKQYPCVNETYFSSNFSQARRQIQSCATAHEQNHIDSGHAVGCRPCGIYEPGQLAANSGSNECASSRSEIGCLEKVRCKRGSNCDREIATRIGHIEEYANWRQAGCF
jgi:RHS repeat-associated protein